MIEKLVRENPRREIAEGIGEYMSKDEIFIEHQKEVDELLGDIELLKKYNSCEDSSLRYETYDKVFNEIANLVKEGKFEVIKESAKKMLYENGIKAVEKLDIHNAPDNILLTEAVNWAAKVVDENFYLLKPAMILASMESGAILGVEDNYDDEGNNDQVYYLVHKDVGVASFHNPNGEVKDLAELSGLEEDIEEWKYGWEKIVRQDEAFELLEAYREVGDKERRYFKKMRYRTMPGKNIGEKYRGADRFKAEYEKYMKDE